MERSLLLSACFLIAYSSIPVLSIPPLLGIHPLDERYFASEVIKCKDGSKSFARDRVNDNFCDCADGTDEPGTSACPTGKFYCKNIGSTPRFLFSSRVNDRICDCCDGSDEYDGSVNCPNTCVMGGNVVYKMETYNSTISTLGSIDAKESKSRISLEDLIQKLEGILFVCDCLGAIENIYDNAFGLGDSRIEDSDNPTGGSHQFFGSFVAVPTPYQV